MRTAAIWFAQESSPPVPDEATRLRLLTGAMGTQLRPEAGIRELAHRDRGICVMGTGTVLSLDAGPLARFAGSGDAQRPELPRHEGA
jgi:hypothetical protein